MKRLIRASQDSDIQNQLNSIRNTLNSRDSFMDGAKNATKRKLTDLIRSLEAKGGKVHSTYDDGLPEGAKQKRQRQKDGTYKPHTSLYTYNGTEYSKFDFMTFITMPDGEVLTYTGPLPR